jgi:CheY-like chemotaxis protein
MAKVLVLDDDRLSQKLLGKVFSNAGHETLAALTTQQAWEKLH